MYLRKHGGPRSVTLPDGTILSRADLPAPEVRRWVASRKRRVVLAVAAGLIGEEEALARWDLSAEELAGWRAALDRHGPAGLKATARHRSIQL